MSVRLLLFLCVAPVIGSLHAATIIQRSPYLKHPGFMGTCAYAPLPDEVPFFSKLSSEEKKTVSGFSAGELQFFESDFFTSGNPASTPEKRKAEEPKFSLQGHVGEFVSWFGILRESARESGSFQLTIQNKYSTGMSDCHIQTVSIRGGGDFRAVVDSDAFDLPPLVLVRIYGEVASEKEGIPTVDVEYLRYWRWMDFNFMDYGQDSGTSSFDKTLDLSAVRIYSARVNSKYYAERIEATEEQKREIKKWWTENVAEMMRERQEAENEK